MGRVYDKITVVRRVPPPPPSSPKVTLGTASLVLATISNFLSSDSATLSSEHVKKPRLRELEARPYDSPGDESHPSPPLPGEAFPALTQDQPQRETTVDERLLLKWARACWDSMQYLPKSGKKGEAFAGGGDGQQA